MRMNLSIIKLKVLLLVHILLLKVVFPAVGLVLDRNLMIKEES